jgi:hypothetical protein
MICHSKNPKVGARAKARAFPGKDALDAALKRRSTQPYFVANAFTGAMFWIMWLANSLVLTLVAPSNMRSKS